MKKFALLVVAGLFSLSSVAQEAGAAKESGIKFFHGTLGEALKEAAKQKKILFVDAYASWCGPCRWMANNVFTQEEVGKFYNEKFVNYKFDMEKGEGPVFAGNYKVTAYPTFIYLDNKGNVKYRTLGARSAEEFISEGKKALAASQPN